MKIRLLVALAIAICVPMAFSQRNQKDTNAAPEVDELLQSREAGLLTDWNLFGPYGKKQADFSRAWAPERKMKENAARRNEDSALRFADGQFVLPAKTANGVYYAKAHVYLFSDGDWNVWAESANAIQVFVDGVPVLARQVAEQNTMRAVHESVHLSRGQHTVLAKFVADAAPFRVAIIPPSGGLRRKRNIPLYELAPETLVLSASLR